MPKKTPGRRTQFIPRIFRERRCRAASASAWLPKGNPEPTTKLLPRDTQRLGAQLCVSRVGARADLGRAFLGVPGHSWLCCCGC